MCALSRDDAQNGSDAQAMYMFESSCFILHGPLISMVALDTGEAVPVSNFTKGLVTLCAVAADASIMV